MPGDPNTFLQRTFGVLPSLSPKRFSGKPTGQVVFDSHMGYVDSGSGLSYSGKLGTTGNWVINGKFSTTPPPGTADPNLPQFDVTHTIRQPAIAALTDSLTKQASQQATSTGNDLATSLSGLQDIATRSYTRSQGATDTGQIEAQLTGSMTAQEKAQRNLATQQGQRNKDFSAETEAMLAKLSAENKNWEATTNAIGERAGAAAITGANLIPLARGGNPAVRSGAQPSRVAVSLANALLPTQQAISARRYAQVANIEQPWRQNLYAQDTALIASNQALESSFGGNWRSIYQYIQDVKRQASQMDAANAERYIAQALALKRVPAEFLSNQISMASALQRLDDAATENLVSQNIDTSQFAGGPSFSAPPVTHGQPNNNFPPGFFEALKRYNESKGEGMRGGGVGEPDARNYWSGVATPGFVPSMYNPDLGPLELGPNNRFYYTPPGQLRSTLVNDNVTLPNNYGWGRTPTEQQVFEDIQRGYE